LIIELSGEVCWSAFMNIAFTLKNEIILTLPAIHPGEEAPASLLSTITQFLTTASHLAHEEVIAA